MPLQNTPLRLILAYSRVSLLSAVLPPFDDLRKLSPSAAPTFTEMSALALTRFYLAILFPIQYRAIWRREAQNKATLFTADRRARARRRRVATSGAASPHSCT